MNDQNQVLVSDERRNGVCFSKFPGGGVEFSEGLHDALQREFMEELKIEIQIGNLFYVNTHLQISAFNSNQQLLAFYFFVNTLNHSEITTSNNYKPLIEDGENQRWVQVNEELKNLVTFPLDKIVADKLVKFLLNE
jgi:8-oxo-dGTP pyrophosphatase MutT (NUDIX family)